MSGGDAGAEREGEDPGQDYLLEEVLCIHCLEVIPFEANLCRHCKAPQNFLASTLPYERIHAEGFILRTAVEGTRSLVVLVGIWLLFFPILVVMVVLALVFPAALPYLAAPAEMGSLALSGLGGLVAVVILYRSTANTLRKRREPEGGCDAVESE